MILRRGRARVLVALAVSIAAGSMAPLGAAGLFSSRPYPDGEMIQITGLVTDSAGDPIPRVRLQLEASRRSFKVTKLKKVDQNLVRVGTSTDDAGEFTLDWKWHRYYNHFELKVVLAVRKTGGREEIRELASLDLSERIRTGSPVVAPITVADTSFLETYRAFLAAIDTDDERQVFDAMGRPDKVEAMVFPDRREESWWYFKMGRTYRFKDGALDEVVEFDPVKDFAGAGD